MWGDGINYWQRILKLILIVSLLVAVGASSWRYVLELHQQRWPTLTVWETAPSVLHLPFYVAMQEGYFKQQKIRVQVIKPSTEETIDPYQEHVSDIILADPVDALYHLAIRHKAPQVVMALTLTGDSFLLAAQDRQSDNFTPENLKGARIISYPPETGPGQLLENIIREQQMRPHHDVTLYQRIPEHLRLGVFRAGGGDYIQLNALEAAWAEKAGIGTVAGGPLNPATTFPAVLCVARPQTITEQKDAVQAFVNALYKAQLALTQQPQLATLALKPYMHQLSPGGPPMDPAILQQLTSGYLDLKPWAHPPTIDQQTLKNYVASLYAAGQLPSQITYDEAMAPDFAQRAMESVVFTPPKKNG